MTVTINASTLLTIGVAIITILIALRLIRIMWDERPTYKAGLYHCDKESIAEYYDRRERDKNRVISDKTFMSFITGIASIASLILILFMIFK